MLQIPPSSQLEGRNVGHSLLKAVVTAAFFLSVSAVVWAQSAPRLAFQVYAVRDLCEKGFVGTLKAVRAMGYDCVEIGRFYWLDAKSLKATTVEKVVERLNRLTKGWGAFYSVGYPSKAFHAVNGYALRRMARHLNHRSQRRYRLKFADTYYGELNHYGMYWLKWADVRRRRY